MGMDICILEWLEREKEGLRIIEVCLIGKDQRRRWKVRNVRKGWIEVEVWSLLNCDGGDC